jgi:hypothetical protein
MRFKCPSAGIRYGAPFAGRDRATSSSGTPFATLRGSSGTIGARRHPGALKRRWDQSLPQRELSDPARPGIGSVRSVIQARFRLAISRVPFVLNLLSHSGSLGMFTPLRA